MNLHAAPIVDVWLESLIASDYLVQVFYELLSAPEKQRCDRITHPRSRRQHIVARGQLRVLLGHYLQLAPELVQIDLGPQGKPQVEGLEFNLSHSGNLVAYAFGKVPLGIDVEQRRHLDAAALVKRFFTPEEWQEWQELPVAEQERAFFQVWTIKEAYVKAIGTGLARSLSTVPVQLSPPWQLRQTAADWQIEVLDLPTGYLGAVAIQTSTHQNHECRINRFGIGR
jgi:4'-phosphopantetheinyl transferase